jgi:hypothetical protein
MASVNNTLIGAVRTEATLESGKFVDGAKKIRIETQKTETQLKKSFGAMGAAVKGFAGAMTAGLSIGLLAGLAKRALDFAKNIGVVAKQLNVTTKELQTFRFAAEQMGVKNAEADKGLERLGITLGKAAAGSTSATKALASVGVSLNDIQTKSRTEIFGQIADQMIKQGGAAKNAAAANAIFEESASKLTPLLDQGSRGINELSQAAERLGIVLSDQQIQQADETARKLEAVKTVLEAQIAGVVADNAASIVTLANALATLTGAIVNFLGSNPTAALAILGALAGARFGPIGAAAGGFAGAVIGSGVAGQRGPIVEHADPLLRHNFIKAVDEGKAARLRGDTKSANEAYARAIRLRSKFVASGGVVPGFNPNVGGAAIPQFLAPSGGGGGRKARTPRAPRDRSDDVTFQFEQELRRAQMDTLRAQQSMATTAADRARLALELLDLQREDQEAELANRVRRAERDFAEGKITEGALEEVRSQADKLRAQYSATDALERQAIADNLAADQARDSADLRQSGYDLEIEALQMQSQLAETASERREVELRILELMKEQERARLEAVIADQQSSELAKAQAQQRLGQLDSIYAGRAAVVTQGTRGPWEDYLASLPTTAAKANEALERLQVQGMEGLLDATLALADGMDSAKEALLDTLKQFLLGLARMHGQAWMGSLFQGGGSGLLGSLGSIFGGTGGATGPVTSPPISGDWIGPRFHSGGSMVLRGLPGIDRNVISMNGIPIARADYGERISFTPANDRGGARGGMGGVTMNIYTPDADSFRRSEGQTTRALRRRMNQAF